MIGAAVRLGIVAVLAGLIGGCVEHPGLPARTDGAYEQKSKLTASAAGSAVGTVVLVLDAVALGNTTAVYRDETVSDAEGELEGTVGSYSSIQPPTDRSVRRRHEVMDVLGRATTKVADVRIALRLGHQRDALDQRRSLDRIGSELEKLSGQ